MALFGLFTSRQEKNILLSEIIQKLHISKEEKELYILSIKILDDSSFNQFYNTIMSQMEGSHSTIEPLSTQLI